MASSNRRRALSCEGKRRYKSANEAREMARHRREESGDMGISEYPCAFCGGWHIGHNAPKKPRL